MHQTNVNSGDEYLSQMRPQMTLAFWKYNGVQTLFVQAGLRLITAKLLYRKWVFGDEGYFKPIDRSFNSFNASLGYKTNLVSKYYHAFIAFRAPNLAELTSNGVQEGTNRYEIGNEN
jgi:iron complex outermembrane receptor protein